MKLLKQAKEISEKGFCTEELQKINSTDFSLQYKDLKILHDIMIGPHVTFALVALQNSGFLNIIIPQIKESLELKSDKKFKEIWPHTLQVINQSPPILSVRWAALFHDLGKATSFKIKDDKVTFYNHEKISANIFRSFAQKYKIFTYKQINEINIIVNNLGYIESYSSKWTDSAVRRFYKQTDLCLLKIIILSKADITTGNFQKRNKILNKISQLENRISELKKLDEKKNPLPKGLGTIIASEFNIPIGKEIGKIKEELEKKIEKSIILGNMDIQYYIDYLKTLRR
jgi:putative nucleotidyltransferase with HDIG domain